MKDFVSVLSQCPLFEDIQSEDISGMLDCLGGRKITVLKGQTVFLEGDPTTYIGIVLEGAVQLVRSDYYGNRSIVAHIGPGELFGESYACAGIPSLPISVVADENSQILLVECRKITVTCSHACGFHTQIIYNMLKLVANKNLVFDQKIQITSKRTTREKLIAYLMNQMKLQNSNHFSIPYDRQELADYLEVDRSGLSAQISKLRKEGVLESHKNTFTIL